MANTEINVETMTDKAVQARREEANLPRGERIADADPDGSGDGGEGQE